MEKIKRRVRAWEHFFAGKSTLWQTILFMMPVGWRPRRTSVAQLFGKPVIIPANEDMEGFLGLKEQIVDQNGYHTELIPKDAVVVDAGANIGIFSIFAASQRPDITVYAFEPTPETFEALKENTKYYPNIKAFNCGLGEKEEMASVIIGKRSGANRIGKGGIPIPIKTIDSLNLPMKFLKMDVEGYEGSIMKGAARTIATYKPVIIMSAYHRPDDTRRLPEILNGIAPYDCELKHEYEDDFLCVPR